jgi:hypothetical protein
MKLLLFTSALIAGAIPVVWALTKISKKSFNIKALKDANRYPDMTKRKCGILVDVRKKKLVADQSPVTPF